LQALHPAPGDIGIIAAMKTLSGAAIAARTDIAPVIYNPLFLAWTSPHFAAILCSPNPNFRPAQEDRDRDVAQNEGDDARRQYRLYFDSFACWIADMAADEMACLQFQCVPDLPSESNVTFYAMQFFEALTNI
jgi:hypothetical protein